MVKMATIRNRGEYQWEAQIRRKGYPAQRKFAVKAIQPSAKSSKQNLMPKSGRA
jgi:hypothetical protein